MGDPNLLVTDFNNTLLAFVRAPSVPTWIGSSGSERLANSRAFISEPEDVESYPFPFLSPLSCQSIVTKCQDGNSPSLYSREETETSSPLANEVHRGGI
jgi:hypothetical protein